VFKRKPTPHEDPTSIGNLYRALGGSDRKLEEAKNFQHENPDEMLGEALVRVGGLTRPELEALIMKQRALRTGAPRDVVAFVQTVAGHTRSVSVGLSALGLLQKIGKG
jgi:hypothetical protein